MTPQEVQHRIQKAKENHLTTLDLSNEWNTPNKEKLTSIPSEVFELEWLEELDLSNNQLSEIPEAITCLSNLSQLYLSNNQLSEIPEAITRLSNLSQLDLSDNQLREIPAAITCLSNLSILYLSSNKLAEIPEAITCLSNLSILYLSSNKLAEIPEAISRLSNLSQLSLSNNKLAEIPEVISRLSNLSILYWNSNKLAEIPEAISRLSNLSQLYLSRNQLREIPEAISRLSNLSILYLSRNQLREIPEAISRLSNLSQLYLDNNRLREMPEAIFRLSNLSQLYLDGNPLETPPLNIAEEGIEAMRIYFKDIQQSGQDTLYEAKLIIIGEGEAGKTTLMKKILNPNYDINNNELSTEGIDVQEYHFPCENDQDFRVNIWDFGGQEIYHATHQFFLTKRSLYLLIADSRREQPNFDYWLDVIELFSEKSPVLIIKNEKQNRQVILDEPQLKSLFDNIKEFLITNLADNRGLEDIINSIKYHIQKLPHIGLTLPKSWGKVREALEKLAQDNINYISLDRYYQICDDNGFTSNLSPSKGVTKGGSNTSQGENDGRSNLPPFQGGNEGGSTKDRRLILSQYLHDIGVILHFQDDIKSPLYKTIILNPEWGTDAVYKILDNPTVKDKLGQFNDTNINQIWSDAQYNNMQGELLQLMLEFKLAYPLPNNNDTYIAPELLDPNQPNYDWNEANNLRLRYQYDFMPKGILTRFIVELHRLIDEPNVWKTGVILQRDNTKAEIIETYDRREIRIRLSGNNKRDLLTIITNQFDEINITYNFNERLQVRKLIPCNCDACKNTDNPTFYNYRKLRERIDHNRQEIECDKPPYNTVNVLSLIDDIIGNGKLIQDEPRDKDHPEIIIPNNTGTVVINPQGDVNMTNNNNQTPKIKSAWANGLFYLFVFVVVVAGIGYLAGKLDLIPFIFVIVAGVLFVPLIGALQLRQDDRLSEKGFLELMKMVIGQLPLIGNMLGNLLNPSNKDKDKDNQ
ncbi:MAG: COR domain-containing protein [Microcystaceae cyanobacterium]